MHITCHFTVTSQEMIQKTGTGSFQFRFKTYHAIRDSWYALSARNQLKLRDHKYGASVPVLHGMPVYSPAFTGIYCIHPQRDGQAEFTRVSTYTQRQFNCPPIPVLVRRDMDQLCWSRPMHSLSQTCCHLYGGIMAKITYYNYVCKFL